MYNKVDTYTHQLFQKKVVHTKIIKLTLGVDEIQLLIPWGWLFGINNVLLEKNLKVNITNTQILTYFQHNMFVFGHIISIYITSLPLNDLVRLTIL